MSTDRPWLNEPDRVEFTVHGLPCLIKRNPNHGYLLGYVHLPASHPLSGVEYDHDDLPDVHGGWTYSECHEPACKPVGGWRFGFDCGPGYDVMPSDVEKGYRRGSASYRTVEYVREELERAAAVFVSMLSAHAKITIMMEAAKRARVRETV